MDLPWERENRLQFSLITGFSQVGRTAEKRDGGRVLLSNQAWSTCCHIARWSICYLPLLQGSDVICRSFCSIPAWLGADGGTLPLLAVRKANRLGRGTETPIPVFPLSGRRVTRILLLLKLSPPVGQMKTESSAAHQSPASSERLDEWCLESLSSCITLNNVKGGL